MDTSLNDAGNDGSEWIVEARQAGRYHIVSRWSPTPEDVGVRPVGMLMLELAGLEEVGRVY
ncbi:hypothetical protein U91I_00548 [alpha proteobacterium U9-1i]|nr:hypothetical protein U91I_00548 [alpha proteobacterium U9-1i]